MKTLVLWTLIVVNVALLASLIGGQMRQNQAVAQQAAQRRPADYLMIPGEIVGGRGGVIYFIDMSNGQLSAMNFSGRELSVMPPIDLNRVLGGGATLGEPTRR